MSIASEREDRMRVAKTILEQLGGNKFRMMTGAKKLAGDENSLSMRIGRNSSNSNRLREIAERSGVASYLIDSAGDVDLNWFKDKNSLGITSGASAPEHLVQELLGLIHSSFNFELIGSNERQDEGIFFKLPKQLRT